MTTLPVKEEHLLTNYNTFVYYCTHVLVLLSEANVRVKDGTRAM